ncbi:MAG TPA: hypothetical protein VGI64_19235 [Streptosporangiaceae bacterium]
MAAPQSPAGHQLAGRAARARRPSLVAAAAILSLSLAGCAKFDASLGQQWAVVQFKSNTTVATLLHVRAACSHVPNVQAEALPKVRSAMNMVYALRYRTNNASNANLAALQECLQKFPSVSGVNFEDTSDTG